MATSFLSNPKHWWNRAEATRAKAEKARGDQSRKQRLFRIAQEYERLAVRAEEIQMFERANKSTIFDLKLKPWPAGRPCPRAAGTEVSNAATDVTVFHRGRSSPGSDSQKF